MALPNRLVKGYTAQQGLRSPGTSLLSNTGRAARPPRMATARLTEGGRIAPTQAFASRTFEGISGGLDYAQQVIPKAVISFLDQKNILSALKQKAAYQDEVSKLLYGYNEQVLQPDGSYKTEFRPGYTGLQGTEAVNSYGSYEEAVRAKHAELMDELEPAAQREFAVQSIEVLTGALTKGRQHAAGALKKASEDALDLELRQMTKSSSDFIKIGDFEGLKQHIFDNFSRLQNTYNFTEAQQLQTADKFIGMLIDNVGSADGAVENLEVLREQLGDNFSLNNYTQYNDTYYSAVDKDLRMREKADRLAERNLKRQQKDNFASILVDLRVNHKKVPEEILLGMLDREELAPLQFATLWNAHGYNKDALSVGAAKLAEYKAQIQQNPDTPIEIFELQSPQDIETLTKAKLAAQISEGTDKAEAAYSILDSRYSKQYYSDAIYPGLKETLGMLIDQANLEARKAGTTVTYNPIALIAEAENLYFRQQDEDRYAQLRRRAIPSPVVIEVPIDQQEQILSESDMYIRSGNNIVFGTSLDLSTESNRQLARKAFDEAYKKRLEILGLEPGQDFPPELRSEQRQWAQWMSYFLSYDKLAEDTAERKAMESIEQGKKTAERIGMETL